MRSRFATTFRKLEKHWLIVVIVAMLAVVALDIAVGIGQSVWFDEGYSITLAQRPLHELINLTKIDAHPPFYYMYLKAWGMIFGWSELSLRLSSIVPAAAAVGVMAVLVRRLLSTRAALVVLPFLVFAPFLVRYGYEIRMYALILLLAAAGTYALVVAKASGSKKWWLTYALIIALSMYTLYMSIVIWIGHAVWLLYTDIAHKKNPILQKQWLFYMLAVVIFLPWVPDVIYQTQHSALPPYSGALNLPTLANVMLMLTTYTSLSSGLFALQLAVAVFLALLVWTLVRVWRNASKKEWQPFALLLIIFLAAVVSYMVFSMPLNVLEFVERYMVHVSIFFYALVGLTIAAAYQRKFKAEAVGLTVLGLGLFVYGIYSLALQGNYNFQRLQPTYGNTIRAAVGCDDNTQIITAGAYGYIDMWYEFQGCNFMYFQPLDLTYVGGFAPLNSLNTTKRIKQMSDVTADRAVFIYFDDNTDILKFDDGRYSLEKQLDYTGAHVQIYRKAS